MTNLKTLKDIFVVKEDLVKCSICGNTAVKIAELQGGQKKLKAEAIKWIKELEKGIKEIQTNPESRHQLDLDYYRTGQFNELLTMNFNQILWIKHFFNITDEDLK